MGLVTKQRYEHDVKKWRDEYDAKVKADAESGKSGGNYYATQASYLGEKYMSLAFSNYYRGKISVEQLADYLNVSAKNIPGLEQFIFSIQTASPHCLTTIQNDFRAFGVFSMRQSRRRRSFPSERF